MTRRINLIVVHCAATPPDMDVGVAEIRKWHLARGWSDIGYHRVIRRDGRIEQGRDFEVSGAHAKGHNRSSIGVCMIGGVDEKQKPDDNFTDAQYDALDKELADLMTVYPDARVVGHRDLPNVDKACPSFDVATWLASRKLLEGDPGQGITVGQVKSETQKITTADVVRLMAGESIETTADNLALSDEARAFVRILYQQLGEKV